MVAVTYTEGEAISVTGAKLFTASYVPEGVVPTAILVFHHGLGEHIGRYRAMATTLAEQGIAVYLHDAFGHGKSTGERAYIPSADLLVGDLQARRIAAVVETSTQWSDAHPALFLGGHSMGGLLAALATQQRPDGLAGALVMSPAIGIDSSLTLKMQEAVAKLLVLIVPHAKLVKVVDPSFLNADPKLVQEYIDDPLITLGNLSVATAVALRKASPGGMNEAFAAAPAMTTPLYIHHGDHDMITYEPATRDWVAAAGSKDKTFKPLPGSYHEALLGPGKEDIIQGIADWILARSSSPAKL